MNIFKKYDKSVSQYSNIEACGGKNDAYNDESDKSVDKGSLPLVQVHAVCRCIYF